MKTLEQILKEEGVMNEDDQLNFDYERCALILMETYIRNFWEWVNKGETDSYATRPEMVDEFLQDLPE